MRYGTLLFFTALFLQFVVTSALSQEVLEVDQENSKVWVDGTSTLKNWSAQVKSFEGRLTLDDQGQVTSVELGFDASTMDGGRGADMNNKIYKALKTSEHPKITFNGGPVSTSSNKLSSEGTISIAGKERQAVVSAEGSFQEGIKGSQALKLSDFDIEPPTAMFGQIVCHDDITIGFELVFK